METDKKSLFFLPPSPLLTCIFLSVFSPLTKEETGILLLRPHTHGLRPSLLTCSITDFSFLRRLILLKYIIFLTSIKEKFPDISCCFKQKENIRMCSALHLVALIGERILLTLCWELPLTLPQSNWFRLSTSSCPRVERWLLSSPTSCLSCLP